MLTFLFFYSIIHFVPSEQKTLSDSGSVGRVRPCQGRGRGFEPRLSLLKHDSNESCFFFSQTAVSPKPVCQILSEQKTKFSVN